MMQLLIIIYLILREAVVYLWRNKTITILSIAVTSFSLFIIAFFLASVENMNTAIENITAEINVNIYLKDDVTDVQKQYIEKLIESSNYMSSYTFISKSSALQDFLKEMPNFNSLIANLKENPIPSSYRIVIKKEYNSENALQNFIKIFNDAEGIEEIQYDRQWFERLISFVKVLKFAGLIVGTVLIFTALFTIANVIRLVVYGRKDEIEILRLVGASNFYIKGPFILEGIFQGFAAGVLSVFVLFLSYKVLLFYVSSSQMKISVDFIHFLSSDMQALVMLFGACIGFLGSFFSVSHLLHE